ncbi:PREDICTED: stearoyl-CoA desaturase 5-like, partial [Nicrophorus vespilloides]|uniref:Stearoyl-CoA desaturase 5-like n=1 Tax=Nicrophorus vespilloides TaxID=110193 RepID=A0ABM1NJD7_NICVS
MSKVEQKKETKKYKWDIVWLNVVLLGVLHILAVYGYTQRFKSKLQTLIFIKTFRFLANLGVTAGAHRLWSHRSYKASLPFQALLATMMTFTYQNSIYIWCRDHRLHHKYSETDADPHNAKRGFFFSHVGWLLVRKHPDIIEKGKTIDMSDLKANPVVMFQHKYYLFLVTLLAFVFPAFVPWYFWNEDGWNSILGSVASYVVSVNLTWCINSLAHLYGEKPYDKTIGPTENTLMRYIGIGEGFHNYHHTFPSDYRASEFGFETRNITAGFIDLMAALGQVTDRKTTPKDMIEKRATRTGDGRFGTQFYNNLKSMA